MRTPPLLAWASPRSYSACLTRAARRLGTPCCHRRAVRHLDDVNKLHAQDVQGGAGHVYLPYALEHTDPNASHEWVSQEVFPAVQPSRDPRTSLIRRHHVHTLVLQRVVQAAVRQAELPKAASGHPVRHSCATHRLEAGVRHPDSAGTPRAKDVSTTMPYPHVLQRGGCGVKSPADLLAAAH